MTVHQSDDICLLPSNENEKIIQNWLNIHQKITAGFAAAACIVEIVMCFVLNSSEKLVTIELSQYVAKYVLAPIAFNFLLLLLCYGTTRSSRISPLAKHYTVSFTFVGICFVLFSIHSVFPSLALLFIIPILLTTTYGDYMLTCATALLSLISLSVSKLFIFWDAMRDNVWQEPISMLDFLISALILFGLTMASLVIIYYERQKNAAIIRQEMERQWLKRQMNMDSLTGLYNRGAFEQALEGLEHHKENACLVMADLDYFKKLNDTYGHIQGDRCLREFATILREEFAAGAAFRYGGDEFCVLVLSLSREQVLRACNRVRHRLRNCSIDGVTEIRASFGVAEYIPGMLPKELLRQADEALYSSKEKRDTIRIYGLQ